MSEVICEECQYYDSENENCTYIACDGIDCDDAPCGFPYLEDFYKYDIVDDETIIVDGKEYKHEITLNPYMPDSKSSRVFIDGKYYYFG